MGSRFLRRDSLFTRVMSIVFSVILVFGLAPIVPRGSVAYAEVPSDAVTVTIGDGTEVPTRSSHTPYHSYWNNCLDQSVYRASEFFEDGTTNIITSGTIYSIAYYVGATGSETHSLDIYMGYTSATDCANALTEVAEQTLVYTNPSKVLAAEAGWETLELSTPFEYDSSKGNLVVSVIRKGEWTPNAGYRLTALANGSRGVYGDNTTYTLDDASATSAENYRANTQFEIVPITVMSTTRTISSAAEFAAFAEAVNQGDSYEGFTVILTNDIDLSSIANWTPVGTSSNPFRGTFDGKGFAITGLTVNSTSQNTGLFGQVSGATLKNFTLEGSVTSNQMNTGGVVGWAYGANTFENIGANVTVSSTGYCVGGIVGACTNNNPNELNITRCYNKGNISGLASTTSQIGGIVGGGNYCTLTSCYNTGNITGQSASYCGGVAGRSVYLVGCYSSGTVTSQQTDTVGGIGGAEIRAITSDPNYVLDTAHENKVGGSNNADAIITVTAGQLAGTEAYGDTTLLATLQAKYPNTWAAGTDVSPIQSSPILKWEALPSANDDIALSTSNTEGMVVVVNSHIALSDDNTAELVFSLDSDGYPYVFAGTPAEGRANIATIEAAYPNTATSGQLIYYVTENVTVEYTDATGGFVDSGTADKRTFHVPLDADTVALVRSGKGTFSVPFLAVSDARASQGDWGTALVARSVAVDLDAATATFGPFEDTIDATVTSSLEFMPVASAGTIHMVGNEGSDTFVNAPTFTLADGNATFDKAFIGTAAAASAATDGIVTIGEDGIVTLPIQNTASATQFDTSTWQATAAFHVVDGAMFVEKGTWVERTITVNPYDKTVAISAEADLVSTIPPTRPGEVTIGDQSYHGNVLPFCNSDGNAYTLSVYPASEFTGDNAPLDSTDITAISYYVKQASAHETTRIDIYLGYYVPNLNVIGEREKVYSSTGQTIGASAGWEKYEFDTPFTYHPSRGDLVVLIVRLAPTNSATLSYACSLSEIPSLYTSSNDNLSAYADAAQTMVLAGTSSDYVADAKFDLAIPIPTPTITAQPEGLSYATGTIQDQTLMVAGTSEGSNVTVQWYRSTNSAITNPADLTDAEKFGEAITLTPDANKAFTATLAPTADELGALMGTSYFYCVVSDIYNTVISAPAQVNVIQGASPTITSDTIFVRLDEASTAEVAATGTPTPTFTLADGSAIPEGLTLNQDGTITGTPAAVGETTVTIVAANGVAPDATKDVTIKVVPKYAATQGTVYYSLGMYGSYATSAGEVSGVTLLRVPVDIADVAAYDLDDYGMGALKMVGEDGSYAITQLQLMLYVNDMYSEGGTDDFMATVSDYGSGCTITKYQGIVFPHLTYTTNGVGLMTTASDNVLADGDDIQVNIREQFDWPDPRDADHFFIDADGTVIHEVTGYVGETTTFTLKEMLWDTSGNLVDQPVGAGYAIHFGTEYGTAQYTLQTDANGQVSIALPTAGTYYVWADGQKGAEATNQDKVVSNPAAVILTLKDLVTLEDGTYSVKVSTGFGMLGLVEDAVLVVNGQVATLQIVSNTTPDGNGAPKYDRIAKERRSVIGDTTPDEFEDILYGKAIYSMDPSETARYWDGIGYVVDWEFDIPMTTAELETALNDDSDEDVFITAAHTPYYTNSSGSSALANTWSGSKDNYITFASMPVKVSGDVVPVYPGFPAPHETTEGLIQQLPDPADITPNDEEALRHARAMLDSIPADEAALVTQEAKDKLAACEAALLGIPSVIERICGENYANETAATISQSAFADDSCDAVVLARDDDFADALGATGLAGVLGCPIVLTDRTALSEAAAGEINRLGATKVYIIGGTGAMKEQLETDLQAQCGITDVERLWGENSYDTSLACAKAIVALGGNDGQAIIAMSTNFQDALSMSSYAYKFKVPVVLQTWGATSADRGFTDEAKAWLAGKDLTIAGGIGAISDESLDGLHPVVRLWGETGYDTSNKIAEYMVENGFLSAETVIVTCGAQAPKGVDALAGAALGGKLSAPMLLVNSNEEMEGADLTTVEGFYTDNADKIKRTYVLGGAYVVPADLYAQIQAINNAEDVTI